MKYYQNHQPLAGGFFTLSISSVSQPLAALPFLLFIKNMGQPACPDLRRSIIVVSPPPYTGPYHKITDRPINIYRFSNPIRSEMSLHRSGRDVPAVCYTQIFSALTITHQHLSVYDKYASEKANLDRYGTPEEKLLFEHGEFEKISELLETEANIRNNAVSKTKLREHRNEVSRLLQNEEDKAFMVQLSEKYYEKVNNKGWLNHLTDAVESLFDS